jgi:hypothetical protein
MDSPGARSIWKVSGFLLFLRWWRIHSPMLSGTLRESKNIAEGMSWIKIEFM